MTIADPEFHESHSSRRRSRSAMLLGTMLGLLGLLSLSSVAGAADYSDSCTAPTATVLDGYAGSGTLLRLRVQAATGSPATTWVCYRATSGSAPDIGGRFDVVGATASAIPPSNDSSSQACQNTIPNAVPGVHPLVSGTLLSQAFTFDAYSATGVVWVCAQVGSQQVRVLVPEPGATAPHVVSNVDSPGVPLPAATADPFPSGSCQNSTAGSSQRLANLNSGGAQAWAYEWQPDPSTVNLCARIQSPVTAGGMLSFSTDGSPGVSIVHQTGTDPSVCPFSVFTLVTPAQASLATSTPTPGATTASVCIGAGSSLQTFTVGETGSLAPPTVTFTPDPDNT
jgi:hypothetical protein